MVPLVIPRWNHVSVAASRGVRGQASKIKSEGKPVVACPHFFVSLDANRLHKISPTLPHRESPLSPTWPLGWRNSCLQSSPAFLRVWLRRYKVAGQRAKSGDQVESRWFLVGKWCVLGWGPLVVNYVVGVASLSVGLRVGGPLFVRTLIVEEFL